MKILRFYGIMVFVNLQFNPKHKGNNTMAFSILPRPPSIGKRRNPKLGGKGLRRNGKPKTLKPRNSKIKSTRAYTPEFPERNPPRPPSSKIRLATRRNQRIRPLRPAPRRDRHIRSLKKA